MSLRKSPPHPIHADPLDFDSLVDPSGGSGSPKMPSPLTDKHFTISPPNKSVPFVSTPTFSTNSGLFAFPTENRLAQYVSSTDPTTLPAPKPMAASTRVSNAVSVVNPKDLDIMNHNSLSTDQTCEELDQLMSEYPDIDPEVIAQFCGWHGFDNGISNTNMNNCSADMNTPYEQPGQYDYNYAFQSQPPNSFVAIPMGTDFGVSEGQPNYGINDFSYAPFAASTAQMQTSYSTQTQPSCQLTAVPGGSLQAPDPSLREAEDYFSLYGVDRDNRRTKYRAEKPIKDQDHNWLRTNCTTQGLSTRTGKINAYDPNRDGKYCDTLHPVGEWQSSSGTTFKYTRHGELQKLSLTANEMQEFILEHPLATAKSGRLTLWIQKTPADSGRRYPTVGSSKCRFKDCPASIFSRSIGVGHYRVAIDEQWETHKASRDPYLVAMYVHLYCLERFCNFANLCQELNVRADNRELISEPKGIFLPALESTQLFMAESFIAACKSFQLKYFCPDYPQHDHTLPTAEKNHKATLTCALTEAKNDAMNGAKLAMMEARGLTKSNLLVNKGDVQMLVNARFAANVKRKRKNRKAHRHSLMTKLANDIDNEDDNDDEEEEECHPLTKSRRSSTRSSPSLTPRRATAKREAAIKAQKRLQEIRDELMSDGDDVSGLWSSPTNKRKRRATANEAIGEEKASNKRTRVESVAPLKNNAVMADVTGKTRSSSSSTVNKFHQLFGTTEDIPIDPALLAEAPKAAHDSPVFF